MGSVGLPKYDAAPVRPEQGLLKIRKEMDLFANLRPVMFFDELLECSPLRPEIVRGVDFLCVRELVGGIYFGQRTEEGEYDDGRKEVAHDTMEYSVPEVERIVRLAAEFAMQRGGKLCSVDKANVLASSRLWRRTATALIEREFPEVELEHRLVDRCPPWRPRHSASREPHPTHTTPPPPAHPSSLALTIATRSAAPWTSSPSRARLT